MTERELLEWAGSYADLYEPDTRDVMGRVSHAILALHARAGVAEKERDRARGALEEARNLYCFDEEWFARAMAPEPALLPACQSQSTKLDNAIYDREAPRG